MKAVIRPLGTNELTSCYSCDFAFPKYQVIISDQLFGLTFFVVFHSPFKTMSDW